MPQPTLFINAGGQSRRMGRPKALLPTPQGTPLIRLVVDRLSPLAEDIVIVANDPSICAAMADTSARCLPDAYTDCGPLGGLATALAQVDDWLICVGCDMPLVSAHLFGRLLQLASEVDMDRAPRWDAVVPHAHGRAQPLHALYHPRCLPAVLAQLESGRRRMDSFFAQVRVLHVDEDTIRRFDPALESFANANTEEEWSELALRITASSTTPPPPPSP
ncbi:MAG: molybdenum cofactor guanylyltransferase [Caldilineaceae bacterium]|nr:molybdenum cofactor guanylyltransferase [Caldilineaceae bacterium]